MKKFQWEAENPFRKRADQPGLDKNKHKTQCKAYISDRSITPAELMFCSYLASIYQASLQLKYSVQQLRHTSPESTTPSGVMLWCTQHHLLEQHLYDCALGLLFCNPVMGEIPLNQHLKFLHGSVILFPDSYSLEQGRDKGGCPWKVLKDKARSPSLHGDGKGCVQCWALRQQP